MKNNIAVIFDFDGTILDSETAYCDATLSALRTQGIAISQADVMYLVAGRRQEDIERDLQSLFGLQFDVEQYRERRNFITSLALYDGAFALKPGVREILYFLQKERIRCALATSSSAEDVVTQLESHRLLHCFDVLVTADDVAKGKPAPDPYMMTLHKLRVSARSCIAIEDSEPGIESALSAAIPTIAIPDLRHPDKDLLDRCLAVHPHLFAVVEWLPKFIAGSENARTNVFVRRGIGSPASKVDRDFRL